MASSDDACAYVARKDDPSTWYGDTPDDWVLDDRKNGTGRTQWDCPHDRLDGDEYDYCAFHTDPGDVPADIDEAALLVEVVNEGTGPRRTQFVGATFGAFEVEPGTVLNAGDGRALRFEHTVFSEGIVADDLVFGNELTLRRARFETDGSLEGTTSRGNAASFENATFDGDVSFAGVTFDGYASFVDAAFDGSVSFRRAELTGGTSFRDAVFTGSGGVSFDGATFDGDRRTNFRRVTFDSDDDVTFETTAFRDEGGLSFRDAAFVGDGEVSFEDAELGGGGDVSFRSATFECERASFLFAAFVGDGEVSFEDAEFVDNGSVTFAGARFDCGLVSFVDAVFVDNRAVKFAGVSVTDDGATFRRATFETDGRLSFENADFAGDWRISFADAEFDGDGVMTFEDAEFGVDVTFAGAELALRTRMTAWFGGRVVFDDVEVTDEFVFRPRDSHVRDELSAPEATFRGPTTFGGEESGNGRRSTLGPGADGDDASFDLVLAGGVDFAGATFHDGVDFGDTRFSAGADFSRASLKDADFSGTDLSGSNDDTDVVFDAANLSGVNFAGADLAGASFERAQLNRAELLGTNLVGVGLYGALLGDARVDRETRFWHTAHVAAGSRVRSAVSSPPRSVVDAYRRVLRRGRRPYCVYDPRYEDDDGNDRTNLEKAAEVYGTLESVARDNSLPELASECFLGRKDVQLKLYRRDRRWSKIVRSVVPNVVSRYGESPQRVLTSGALTILTCGLLYHRFDLIERATSAEPVTLFDGLYFSALTFTTLGYGDFNPAGPAGQVLAVVETSLGVVLLAILVFVFGRRATR